jgi:hypothetical protein
MDEEAYHDDKRVQQNDYCIAMGLRASAYVRKSEHSHGSAHDRQVFNYGSGDVDKGKADNDDGEGGRIADKQRYDIADYSSDGKAYEKGNEEGSLEFKDEKAGQIARNGHIGNGDKMKMGNAIRKVQSPTHKNIYSGYGQKEI